MPAKNRKPRRKSESNRVSLADLARICEVSVSTVSRVLNNRLNEFPVSEATKEKILNTAREMGYRPNRLARAIRSQKTYLVAFSVPHTPSVPFDEKIRKGLFGYEVGAFFNHPMCDKYDLVLHRRLEEQEEPFTEEDFKLDLFDGVLYYTPSPQHMEFLEFANPAFPIVAIGSVEGADDQIMCVDIDNEAATRMATHHLLDIGCRNILFVDSHFLRSRYPFNLRHQGYENALQERGIPYRRDYILESGSKPEDVREQLRQFPDLDKVDGILAFQDEIALFALDVLKERGRKVPEDVAVCGFDDTELCSQCIPQLTSVRVPFENLVLTASDLLLNTLEKKQEYKPGRMVLEAEMSIRESTAGFRPKA